MLKHRGISGIMGARAAAVVAVSASFSAGCGPAESARDAGAEPIVLLAAASLHDVLGEVTASFTAATGTPVRLVSGGSNVLATQIIAGAPADLFLSAHEEWTEELAQRGMIRARHAWAGNALVLLVPRDDPHGIDDPQDLLAPAVTTVAVAGARVPAGRYAEQALAAAGVLDALQARSALVRGDDARRTVAFVASGAADAGIGYATDAALDDRITVAWTFPAADHDPITYELVHLERAPAHTAALVTYLTSDAVRDALAARGFTVDVEVAP